MSKCKSCGNNFKVKFHRNFYCSKKCYHQRGLPKKTNKSLFFLDTATILVPIVLVIWIIYFMVPKKDLIANDELFEESAILDSSCDDIVFYLDEEDEKYIQELKSKKR